MVNAKPNAPERMVVETIGDIMLQDVSGDQVIEANRPSVVRNSVFVQQRIASKQLSVVEESTKMTDAELEAKWKKGNYPKSKKQPVEPPQAGKNANPSDAPPPAKDASENEAKPREQKDDESDEEYLEYLSEFDQEHSKK